MRLVITFLFTLCITLGYSQTKKERKVKVTSMNVDMYDGTESKKANELYSLATKKHADEDFKGAIKIYKECVKEDPIFVEAYDNMGLCYRRLGDFKNAVKYYNKSKEIYPKGTMAYQNLGVLYGIQKEYQKAINEYKKLQELYPDNAEGYYGTIKNYLGLTQYENAIVDATKTVEIYGANESPYLHEGNYLLGLSYYYNKDIDNAKIYIAIAKKGGMNVSQKLLNELEIK